MPLEAYFREELRSSLNAKIHAKERSSARSFLIASINIGRRDIGIAEIIAAKDDGRDLLRRERNAVDFVSIWSNTNQRRSIPLRGPDIPFSVNRHAIWKPFVFARMKKERAINEITGRAVVFQLCDDAIFRGVRVVEILEIGGKAE